MFVRPIDDKELRGIRATDYPKRESLRVRNNPWVTVLADRPDPDQRNVPGIATTTASIATTARHADSIGFHHHLNPR